MNCVICHYSEIGLKKGNRSFFERALMDNIRRVLAPSLFLSVRKISGRVLIELTDEGRENGQRIKSALSTVFGISDFLLCTKVSQDIEEIGRVAIDLLKKKEFKTFKVSSKRSEKSFPLTSQEINAKVGELVLNGIEGSRVAMDDPNEICFIELVGSDAFVSVDRFKGLDGLPTGTGGRAVSLLSGGIDSPVASFLAMRRGVKLVFIHFHSYPETSESSIEKVRSLVRVLARYQGRSKLYLVPFAEAQKDILFNVSPGDRIIFYRRLMLRISSEIAKREKSLAIVTGENLGQVASQTLENIRAIERGNDLLILRPLICEDKESIIIKARRIGTYDISILPHDGCCVRFIPRHPETRADADKIIEKEKALDIRKITDRAIEGMTCEKIDELELD